MVFVPHPEKRMPFEPYKGKLGESMLLGRPRINKSHPFFKEFQEKGYLPYKKAMRLVMESVSNEELLQPKKIFMKDLREGLARELKVNPEIILPYTAVDTPFDQLHGVDAFLKIGKDIITLDVSDYPKDESKADIVFKTPPDAIEEKEKYQEAIFNLTRKIKKELEERKKENN